MVTKIIKITGILFLLATLTGCPGEEDCFDMGSTTRVDDLVTISPFQDVYNIGDIIIYKISIPSTNTYFFGEEIDLFEKTNDYNARIYINPIIFTDNEVTYVRGSIEEYNGGWSNVEYNSENNMYELEIQIKLLRTGLYSFLSGERVVFQGSTKCNRYLIETNIEGWDIENEGKIEFVVE